MVNKLQQGEGVILSDQGTNKLVSNWVFRPALPIKEQTVAIF